MGVAGRDEKNEHELSRMACFAFEAGNFFCLLVKRFSCPENVQRTIVIAVRMKGGEREG
jgi:hypothetical protein